MRFAEPSPTRAPKMLMSTCRYMLIEPIACQTADQTHLLRVGPTSASRILCDYTVSCARWLILLARGNEPSGPCQPARGYKFYHGAKRLRSCANCLGLRFGTTLGALKIHGAAAPASEAGTPCDRIPLRRKVRVLFGRAMIVAITAELHGALVLFRPGAELGAPHTLAPEGRRRSGPQSCVCHPFATAA